MKVLVILWLIPILIIFIAFFKLSKEFNKLEKQLDGLDDAIDKLEISLKHLKQTVETIYSQNHE